MTRRELSDKWCCDLKDEKRQEFDADLTSVIGEMVASYNKTIAYLHIENMRLREGLKFMGEKSYVMYIGPF